MTVLKTPEEWLALYPVGEVMDPDGWRGRNSPDFSEPISLTKMVECLSVSTLMLSKDWPFQWDRMSADSQQVASKEIED